MSSTTIPVDPTTDPTADDASPTEETVAQQVPSTTGSVEDPTGGIDQSPVTPTESAVDPTTTASPPPTSVDPGTITTSVPSPPTSATPTPTPTEGQGSPPPSNPPSSTSIASSAPPPQSPAIVTNTVTTNQLITGTSLNGPSSTDSADVLPALAASSNVDTTITSSVFTTVDGVPTTIVTVIPTRLNSKPEGLSSSQRTGIIVGGAVGGCLLILLLLGGAIVYRRRRQNQIMLQHHRLPTPRSNRLEDEDMLDLPGPVVYPAAPRLLRARNTDSGSIFHEGVWPPPDQMLVDPIREASHVDLHAIVDSVMGRDALDRRRDLGYHYADQGTRSSVYSYQQVHSREASLGGNTGDMSFYNMASPAEVSTRSVTFGGHAAGMVPARRSMQAEEYSVLNSPSSYYSSGSPSSLNPRTGLPPGAAAARPQSSLPLLEDFERIRGEDPGMYERYSRR